MRITKWVSGKIHTVRGPIPAREWCAEWAAQIRRDNTAPREAEVITLGRRYAVFATPAPDLASWRNVRAGKRGV